MYKLFASACERLLRIPPPPETPPGDAASMRMFRAAPNFFKYLLFTWGLRTLMAGVGVLVWTFFFLPVAMRGAEKAGFGRWNVLIGVIEVIVLLLTVLFWIYSWYMIRMDFEKRWYIVTDRSLRVREGVLIIREATVTFANIQNISISQGPLQRLLGIADLRVDTAGGGGAANAHHSATTGMHTTFFRGVNNADEIRSLMQERLRRLKDAGLGDHDDKESSPATSTTLLEVLREIHTETVRLRRAV
jgi:uncharacterized membrane protein YdbT with pleckstrin-like domain